MLLYLDLIQEVGLPKQNMVASTLLAQHLILAFGGQSRPSQPSPGAFLLLPTRHVSCGQSLHSLGGGRGLSSEETK